MWNTTPPHSTRPRTRPSWSTADRRGDPGLIEGFWQSLSSTSTPETRTLWNTWPNTILDWRLPGQPHAESNDWGDTVRAQLQWHQEVPKALYSARYYFFAISMTYQPAYHLTSVCLPMTACSTEQYILNKMPSFSKKIWTCYNSGKLNGLCLLTLGNVRYLE